MFQENQQIGPYTLIKKLGEGGFGEVWLAERRGELVTKKVAVKLPHDEQVETESIKQEAELWEQASGHANVLPIIDAEIYDGQVVIVSEYADGGSLHDKLKNQGKLQIKEAVEMIIGILSGLEFLHGRRIIHRDIKPANVLFQGNTPRLMDFGISRAMQTSLQSSTIVGTNAYMPPEAFDGKYSFQSDVWSVGVVLYQLLTGNLPFPQERPTERMFAILQKDFDLLPNYIPQEIQRIITKSLIKLPENRYQTTSLMLQDLQHFLYETSATNSQQQPTVVLRKPVISLVDTSPESPQPVSTDQNSISTNTTVPFETDEVETVVDPINQPKSKGNSFLLISILLGGLMIGGIGTLFVAYNFFGNNPEISSSKDTNSSNVKSSPNTASNLNSENENSLTNAEENSNNIENTKLENAEVEDTPTPKPTLDKVQLKSVMNRYIAGVASVSDGGVEYKKGRKLVYGDLDNDGDEDAVVQFTIEGMGGGNSYVFYLGVFRNTGGKFTSVTDKVVGGKMSRNIDLKSVRNGKIYLDTTEYAENDPACCPTIKKRTTYRLNGDSLTEN